jgi:hypothetical protein
MSARDLPGRHIDDVPYTGLIERLMQINLVCVTAVEMKGELSSEDLTGFLSQISGMVSDAVDFSGASESEVDEVSKWLIEGMSIGRSPVN